MNLGSAVAKKDKPASAKRHSPVFLAVFAVFLLSTLFCICGALVGILYLRLSHHDTQCLWISSHLLRHGKNPYDVATFRQMEGALGLPVGQDVLITRNPPPMLAFVTPLGYLGPRTAVVAWSLLMTACLALAFKALNGLLPRPQERSYAWVAWCFAPALLCIDTGQTGLMVLLGLALFLRFYESAPFWAGAALSLCADKPHLLLPFGLVLIAWVSARRRWAILAGAIAALAAESLLVMAFDPAIWVQYHTAMHDQQFLQEFVPTLSVAFRFAVDKSAFWIEFVPAAAACVWAFWYFWRNRNQWDWRRQGSLLVLVSLVAAPYSWSTDVVIVLPAILFTLSDARAPRRGSMTLLLAGMSAMSIELMYLLLFRSVFYFRPNMLLSLIWLAWYWYAVSGRATTPEHQRFAAA